MEKYTVKVWEDGTKEWYQNGQLHRLDGPAVEWGDGTISSGTKIWFLNGQRHRLDGPAVECGDGSKEWYVNGQRHRLDGPAIEWANGDREWYIEGKKLTEEEFIKRTSTVELTMDQIAERFGVPVNQLKIKKD